MLNKNKILIILAIIVLFFSLYYIFSAKTVALKKPIKEVKINNTEPIKKLSVQEKLELKDKYNNKIVNVLSQYEENLEKIKKTKNNSDDFYKTLDALKLEVLALIVPNEYKNMHLELVLTFSKINELCVGDINEENLNLINDLLVQANNIKNNSKNL